jgi:hypothetical protein
MANNDDDNKKAYGSDMEYNATGGCSVKHQARLPTVHFESLFEDVCLNHAYPMKHKLKDRGMMKNVITSGSII